MILLSHKCKHVQWIFEIFFLRFCSFKKCAKADLIRPNTRARRGLFPVVKKPAVLNYLSRIKIRCYLRPQPTSMPNSRLILPPAVWVYKWHERDIFSSYFSFLPHKWCEVIMSYCAGLWHYVTWLPCLLWPIQWYKMQNIRFLFFFNRADKKIGFGTWCWLKH